MKLKIVYNSNQRENVQIEFRFAFQQQTIGFENNVLFVVKQSNVSVLIPTYIKLMFWLVRSKTMLNMRQK